MSRGRRPLEAQEKAFSLAAKRGLVQRYQHRRGNTCDFTIMSPGLVTFATVKRLDRLTVTPEDILYDFTAEIALLRFIVSSPGISRELWLRTPHGAWRFFRVLENGIIELDHDGKILENGKGLAKSPAATMPVKKPDTVQVVRKKRGRKRKDGAVTSSLQPEQPDAEVVPAKDQEASVVGGNYAQSVKNPEPAKSSAPAKDPGPEINPAPDLISQKNSGPGKNMAGSVMPEKFDLPVQDRGPAPDRAQQPEPEKIPPVIEKFLRRRKKGLKKLADGNDESPVEPDPSPGIHSE